jgi:hypothetical protein
MNDEMNNILVKYDLTTEIKKDGEVYGKVEGLSGDYVRNHYKVTVNRFIDASKSLDAKKSISFEFTDSINNTEKNLRPTVFDVLNSFILDYGFLESENIKSVCDLIDYGYDCRKAKQIFKALKLNMEKALILFSEEEIYNLSEDLREYEEKGGI